MMEAFEWIVLAVGIGPATIISELEGKVAVLTVIALIVLMIAAVLTASIIASTVGEIVLGIVSMYIFVQLILVLFIG